MLFLAVCQKDDDGAAPRAMQLLVGMMRADRDMENPPLTTVITDKVYGRLRPKLQESYHAPREIRGITVHERFREDMEKCFVILPIGLEGSDTRKRADEVFTHCIKPACEETKYQAIRGDMMSGDRVTPEIEEAIRTSPMVIAYFGSPPWNPNVMYEFGRRIESGMPYVVLKDEKTAEGELTELPFDLKDERVADLSTPLDLNLEAIGPKIRTIRKLILDRSSNPCGFTTVYPSAVVELPIDREGLRKVKEASDVLEELFEMPNIGGRHLYEVIRHLETKMTPNQYAAFLEDQRRVTNDLLSGDPFYDLRQGGNACALASASVPIVFSDHNTLRGHAYLPVIVRHARVKSSDAWRLDVVYIEVTAACHWDDRGKFYRCRLVDNNVLDPNPEADSKRVALKALG